MHTVPRSLPATPLHMENIKAVGEAMFVGRPFTLVGPQSRQWATMRLAESFALAYLKEHHAIITKEKLDERIAMLETASGMRGTKLFVRLNPDETLEN